MKHVLALLVLSGAFCVAHAQGQGQRPAPRIQLVDRIVAVINSEVITSRELATRLGNVQQQLKRQNTTPPPDDVLQKQLLERLITDRIQLQLARDTALRVDDLQLDRAIERIAQDNRMSLAEFRAALEKDGVVFSSFREDIRTEIILSRLREREVDSKIVVGESEIDNFIAEQEQSGGADAAVEYNLAHILLRLPEQASPEQIERQRARAESVIKQLKAGGEFAQLAASFSDAPDALQGGVMGWRSLDRLPELFAAAVPKIAPGQVSEILRSPAGFHVLKVVEKRGGTVLGSGAPVTQTNVRHILIKTTEVVSEDEGKRKITALRERIVNGGDFAQIARLNSEDGSSARGGELGWIYPGDLVPEFERAMDELKPGQVSEPVRSPFGWHLIEVIERRTADMSSDRKRLEARRALRDRKSDEAFQDWLRQLRDRAYVEYRLEDR